MKIGVMIPLRAKTTTNRWDVVCHQAEKSINSLIRQTSKKFEAVVVGHDRPEFCTKKGWNNSTDIKFLEYDETPPPEVIDSSRETYLECEFDRCRKIFNGMIHLNSDESITHWFAMDADDLLHPNFIHELSQTPKADAFIIQRGYRYFQDKAILHKENDFSAYCGSCSVLSRKLIDLPDNRSPDSFRSTLFGAIPHNQMLKYLLDKKIEVTIPESRLVTYVRGHGANLSDMRYGENLRSRVKFWIKTKVKQPRNSAAVLEDFGLEETKI